MYEDPSSNPEEQVRGFADIRMLFGERNPGRGAYIADTDSFKSIFRFLIRMTANYSWHTEMVMFAFSGKRAEDVPKACDRFLELAAGSLRSSDILFKYSADKVLLLLLKSQEERYKIPLDRILRQWEEEGIDDVEISVRSEDLGENEK